MESICVNPYESLAELLSKKGKIIRGIKLLTNDQTWADHYKEADIELQKINGRIADLERAAKTPGQCIRIV